MKYLLDVNALVALGVRQHEFHARVASWLRREQAPTLATCSITELGFARIVSQAAAYGVSTLEARGLLLRLKNSGVLSFEFVADDHDISLLPPWVKAPKQITDGHLSELARNNGAILATLDARIPGAYLIPEN
jgi:predicted nucleic acid-binding protein